LAGVKKKENNAGRIFIVIHFNLRSKEIP
jgi:hypothetical protein